MKKIVSSVGASTIMLLSSFSPVLAQKINLKDAAPSPSVANASIERLISVVISLLIVAASVIFFLWLVLGGIKWIMSGGDKTKTEEARSQITAALIGLVIVFSAWAIAQLIVTVFGVNIFEPKVLTL